MSPKTDSPAPSSPVDSTAVDSTAGRIATVPNAICLARIGSAPLVLWILSADTPNFLLALAVMAVTELSDLADGFLARKFHWVSDFGKLFDPMVDALYHCLLFAGFLSLGWMPIWAVGVLLTRNITVAYMRAFAAQRGITLAARKSGKLNSLVQCAVCFVIVGAAWAGYADETPLHEGSAVVWGAALTSVVACCVSFYDYGSAFVRAVSAPSPTAENP